MKIASWETHEKGAILVPSGKPLDRVVYVHRGTVDVYQPKTAGASERYLWSHVGHHVTEQKASSSHGSHSSNHGSVIGGTALVDPSVLDRSYPHDVRVGGNERAVVVS